MKTASDELLDRSASNDDIAAISQAVLFDPRIRGLHRLRTRTSGGSVIIQMHVDLDANLTLAQAHTIVDDAEARIREALPGADVLIHADPAVAPAPPPSSASGPWG